MVALPAAAGAEHDALRQAATLLLLATAQLLGLHRLCQVCQPAVHHQHRHARRHAVQPQLQLGGAAGSCWCCRCCAAAGRLRRGAARVGRGGAAAGCLLPLLWQWQPPEVALAHGAPEHLRRPLLRPRNARVPQHVQQRVVQDGVRAAALVLHQLEGLCARCVMAASMPAGVRDQAHNHAGCTQQLGAQNGPRGSSSAALLLSFKRQPLTSNAFIHWPPRSYADTSAV